MKRIAYILLFSCLIFLQGCFEIIEQVVLKNDGSGNFQLVVNMSKSKTKINSIMKMKTVNGHDVPSKNEITGKIKEIEKTFSKTAGITDVKTSVDFDNYIATLNCNFTKSDRLNAAAKTLIDETKSKTKSAEKIYEYDAGKGIFARLNKFSLKDKYTKMSNADKEIFATANYTAIYKFESTIVSASNKDAAVSSGKKAVMLKLNALDIITNKKSIENKINLTKQ